MALLKTILLIDDDDTTNFLHKRLFQRLKIADNIVVAVNGERALTYLEQAFKAESTEALPGLIFLDIKMPIMDGFEFLAAYEKLPLSKVKSIPIYMLTSSVSSADVNRLKKHQVVTSHVAKPLTQEKLDLLLANLPVTNPY